MARHRDLDPDDFGFRRAGVHGTTYDRGSTERETRSGRNYPGRAGRHDPHYPRGPYMPAGYEAGSYGRETPLSGRPYGRYAPSAERYGDHDYGSRSYVPWDERAEGTGPGPLDEDSWNESGPHTGRAPRGYARSDDRIRVDVCERLTHHGHIDPSEVEVSVEDNEVTLQGTVESRRVKRLVEDVAASVPGIFDVHNRLHIRRGEAEVS